MNATTARHGPRTRLLINRNYAFLWLGQSVSSLGDTVFETTLVLWIATRIAHGQTWAPLAVSGVLIATTVPIMALGPIAGVFVDRWDKRRTMLRMDLARAVLILLLLPLAGVPRLGALSMSPAGQVGVIYAVVFLTLGCSQFFLPARSALIGDIVPAEDRPRASSRAQATTALAIIIGPAVAAPLMVLFGVEWALLLNSASFFVSFLAVLAIHPPKLTPSVVKGQSPAFLRELADGLRLFRRDPVLMTLLVTGGVIMLGAGALNALDVFFALHTLHAPVHLYGVLSTGLGVGALVGAILAGLFAERIGLARLVWLSIIGLGVGLLVYSRLTSFLPALVVLTLVGVPMAGVNVAAGPIVLQVTPREFVGRVSSVLNMTTSLASVASTLVAGLLVSTLLHGFHARFLGTVFGPVDTIFSLAALIAIAGGLYAMVNLRGLSPATAPGVAPGDDDVAGSRRAESDTLARSLPDR